MSPKEKEVVKKAIEEPSVKIGGNTWTTYCRWCNTLPNPYEPFEKCPKEPPWWRKIDSFHFFTASCVVMALGFIPFGISILLNPPFRVTPINETLAIRYRAQYCSLRVARLSSLVDPMHWDEETAKKVFDSCLDE